MQKEIKKDSTCLFLFERLYKKMKAYASIFSLYSKNSSYDDKRSKHPFAFNSITRVAIVCTKDVYKRQTLSYYTPCGSFHFRQLYN